MLCTILFQYQDVILDMVPTQASSNWKLGDTYEIPLVEVAEVINKSMYKHIPQDKTTN